VADDDPRQSPTVTGRTQVLTNRCLLHGHDYHRILFPDVRTVTNMNNRQPIVRVSDADESTPRIDFELIDRKYRAWLIRRGFAADEGSELGMKRSRSRRKPPIDE
jgi:hypothetical protein